MSISMSYPTSTQDTHILSYNLLIKHYFFSNKLTLFIYLSLQMFYMQLVIRQVTHLYFMSAHFFYLTDRSGKHTEGSAKFQFDRYDHMSGHEMNVMTKNSECGDTSVKKALSLT